MSTTARTATGDLALPRVIITDPATVAMQTIRDRLSVWLGEWFLDTAGVGFPWFQRVLGIKNPNVVQIKALLRQTILGCPYVVDVVADAVFTERNRSFAYAFAATLNTGQIVKGGSGTPFQVTGGD